MIGLPAGTRIWIAAGVTDMRCGFQGLAAKVQAALQENSLGGHVPLRFMFAAVLVDHSDFPLTDFRRIPR